MFYCQTRRIFLASYKSHCQIFRYYLLNPAQFTTRTGFSFLYLFIYSGLIFLSIIEDSEVFSKFGARNNLAMNAYLIFLSTVAALGGFLFGYDTAVISGTISQVTELFGLDLGAQGWYVGCALVGSIAGVAVAGMLADRFGRKLTMGFSAILFTASAIGCAIAPGFGWLVVYRIIGGAGIGVASIVCPLYISELAVARWRGSLVSLYQLAITVGFLAAYGANYLVMEGAENGSVYSSQFMQYIMVDQPWRAMLGLETLPAALFLLVVFTIPESPRWLALRGRDSQSLGILSRIYPSKDGARREFQTIKASMGERKTAESQWRQLSHRGIRRAVAIGVAIAMLGQFMGVNAVLYYGPTIFEDAGISGGDSLLYQSAIGLVNVLTTVIALLIIDRVGRKGLVYFGVTGMIVSLLLIAAYFTLGAAQGWSAIILLTFFLLYIFFCAISISAVVFVILSEMYPTRVRGLAMSIAGLSLWVGTYLVGQLTPWLLATLSPAGTFLLFALMCVPYMLIMWRLVPETTGKSLEEIERHWAEVGA